MVMLLTDTQNIRDVILFPLMKPETLTPHPPLPFPSTSSGTTGEGE
jgi:aspartyl-tRNA synthetase